MLSVGLVPGLKSVASADDRARIDQARAPERSAARPRWKQQPGSSVQTTPESESARISLRSIFSRWSALAACISIARRAAPVCVELFGVNPRHEAARSPGRENSPRLRHRERAAIAVDVAEFREARRRDRRNPALYEQLDKRIRAAAKFRRHDVRAEKRAGDVERLLLVQIVEDFEHFLLALPVEAVAALGLERGGAVRRELAQIGRSARAISAAGRARRSASTVERMPPPARAICSYVFPAMRCSYSAARDSRENQVRVRIDESGQHDAAAEVELFGAPRLAQALDLAPRADWR